VPGTWDLYLATFADSSYVIEKSCMYVVPRVGSSFPVGVGWNNVSKTFCVAYVVNDYTAYASIVSIDGTIIQDTELYDASSTPYEDFIYSVVYFNFSDNTINMLFPWYSNADHYYYGSFKKYSSDGVPVSSWENRLIYSPGGLDAYSALYPKYSYRSGLLTTIFPLSRFFDNSVDGGFNLVYIPESGALVESYGISYYYKSGAIGCLEHIGDRLYISTDNDFCSVPFIAPSEATYVAEEPWSAYISGYVETSNLVVADTGYTYIVSTEGTTLYCEITQITGSEDGWAYCLQETYYD
jgi:hypothetical protein